jgi:crossover junction endodeoxyribonuclease RuvC
MERAATYYLGIDPGLSGALALYDPVADTLDVRDMPVFVLPKGKGKRTELDLYGLANIFDGWSELRVYAYIEQVSASPQMGVTSAFSFGGSYWAPQAMCAAHFISLTRVPPQVWKRDLKVPASKDGARAKASVLLPKHSRLWTRVKDDGRAEAALIALYGARQRERLAA